MPKNQTTKANSGVRSKDDTKNFIRKLRRATESQPLRQAIQAYLDGHTEDDVIATYKKAADNEPGKTSQEDNKQTQHFMREIRSESHSAALRKAIEAHLEGQPHESIISAYKENYSKEQAQAQIGDLVSSPKKSWQEKTRYIIKYITPESVRAILTAIISPEIADDRIEFFATLMRQARYAEDLCASRAAANWLDDPEFIKAYDAGASISTWRTGIRWRVHTLTKAASQAARVEGDFVECGVSNGGTATSVITYLGAGAFKNRRFFLFDTFEGLQETQMTKQEQIKSRLPKGYYTPVLEQVRKNFKPFDFTEIVPGAVPHTLDMYDGGKVAYLHIDMNVSLPEVEAFMFFWPKITPGGVVVFDDYGFPAHSEQQEALNEVARSFGVEIMMLPTGQGLVWK